MVSSLSSPCRQTWLAPGIACPRDGDPARQRSAPAAMRCWS